MNKEIIIVTGYNASGKSTYTEKYVDGGYQRLNRDLIGGSIDALATKANDLLSNGHNQIVLDNTYPSIASRASIIKVAKDNKATITCIHITTSLEESQMNACLRMIKKTGSLLSPDEIKNQKDPNIFPPAALFHYRKQFQPPTLAEGFDKVNEIDFIRKWDSNYSNKAIILDYDGTLRTSTGKQKYPTTISEIEILPNRTKELIQYSNNGFLLLGVSNQSGVARGTISKQTATELFETTNKLLNSKIDYLFCPHQSNPVICYCRKPQCGHGAVLIEKYKLNPSYCIMVGDMTTDKSFATRCGFNYVDQKDFFG